MLNSKYPWQKINDQTHTDKILQEKYIFDINIESGEGKYHKLWQKSLAKIHQNIFGIKINIHW